MSFLNAIDFVFLYEGGWANNPDDKGGETFRGIARNYNPSWEGWVFVDKMKGFENFKEMLFASNKLTEMAKEFYRANYWDKIHGDELPPKLATAVFDMAVNSGVGTAVRQMQVALGVDVDGVVGSKTIKAAWEKGKEGVVSFLTNRLLFYIGIVQSKPDQRIWAKNWFKRIVMLADIVLED